MEYNQELFGEKRSVFTTVNGEEIRQFDIATQNISVQQGYNSGDFTPNKKIPEDTRLWELGKESILTKISWYQMIDGAYNQWDSTDDERVPMILSTSHVKTSSPNFDVQPTGSGYNLASQCNYRHPATQSNVKPDGQYPLWYLQAPVLTGIAPHFNVLPFILDFNYSGVLVLIYVNTNTGMRTLKDFIDTYNTGTVITGVYIDFYYGDETHKINSNYNHLEGGASSQAYDLVGGCIINSKLYQIPFDITTKINYPVGEMQLASFIQPGSFDNYYRLYPLISSLTPASSLRCSYYKNPDYIDNNGYLIQHGDNKYSEDDFAWILKQVALLGFWFTTDNAAIATRVTGTGCTDINTYLPEIKDGITTGKYWSGTEAANQEAAQWKNDWREQVNYQPGGGSVTPTDESSRSSRLTYSSSLASFGNIWLMNNSGISNLANALKTLVTNEQDPYDPTLFYGQNPVECIISIKEYPIDISSCIDVIKNPEPVSLGRWNNIIYTDGGIGVRLAAPLVTVKSASEPFSHITISIPAHYKDLGYPFMDYEPYSSYHLYLPFCGTVKIPSELAIESRIEVLYYADVLSGACIAHVYINYKYYCSVQGQLATEVPVSGYKISDYTRDMLNATYAQKQAYASIASDVGRIISSAGSAGITLGISDKRAWGNSAPSVIPNMSAGSLTKLGGLTMGFGTAIQAGADMWSKYETIKYNKTILDHSAPAPVKSSLGGGLVNWESPYFVEMLVQRPVFMEGYNKDVFNATMGRACYLADTLDNHSGGYVEAINCKLSGFPATQTEKVELAKLLADGVFL